MPNRALSEMLRRHSLPSNYNSYFRSDRSLQRQEHRSRIRSGIRQRRHDRVVAARRDAVRALERSTRPSRLRADDWFAAAFRRIRARRTHPDAPSGTAAGGGSTVIPLHVHEANRFIASHAGSSYHNPIDLTGEDSASERRFARMRQRQTGNPVIDDILRRSLHHPS